MSDRLVSIAGHRAWLCAEAGPALGSSRDAADIVGETFSSKTRLVVIPAARLAPAFLDLKSRLAGEMLQTFVNYRRHVVILGDISEALARSGALRDFVRESNRGESVWFMPDLAALEARLAQG